MSLKPLVLMPLLHLLSTFDQVALGQWGLERAMETVAERVMESAREWAMAMDMEMVLSSELGWE